MTLFSASDFVGARYLSQGRLLSGTVSIEAGKIASRRHARQVDLTGFLLLPGIIDLSGAGLARHGRRTVGVVEALRTSDLEAASHGATTLWLAQGWGWWGGSDAPDMAEDVCEALKDYRPQALCDLRIQLRVETHMPDTRDALVALCERYGCDHVIFTNRLPDATRSTQETGPFMDQLAQAAGHPVEDAFARIRSAKACAPDVHRHLLNLAEAFDRLGITYGSYDDPDAETRERMGHLGATLAETPLRGGAARLAHANGHPVILDAAHVLDLGATSASVTTHALLAKGIVSAFRSGDHPATLLQAVKLLDREGVMPFEKGWEAISTQPAKVMGLADRGRLEPGLRADIAVLNERTGHIEATLAAGRLTFATGEAALRFFEAGLAGERVAAE